MVIHTIGRGRYLGGNPPKSIRPWSQVDAVPAGQCGWCANRRRRSSRWSRDAADRRCRRKGRKYDGGFVGVVSDGAFPVLGDLLHFRLEDVNGMVDDGTPLGERLSGLFQIGDAALLSDEDGVELAVPGNLGIVEALVDLRFVRGEALIETTSGLVEQELHLGIHGS